MTLRDRLTEDMKQAMKDKEAGKLKLSVIRMVRSAAKNVEIDRRKELDDNELLDVVAKEVKMRRDSLDEFRKAGRPELLAVLEQEIAMMGDGPAAIGNDFVHGGRGARDGDVVDHHTGTFRGEAQGAGPADAAGGAGDDGNLVRKAGHQTSSGTWWNC